LKVLCQLLPFSHDQFFDVFAAYNRALWPFAVLLWMLTVGVFVALLRGAPIGRVPTVLLAVHWAWTAVAYHWAFFAAINPMAILFGAAFLLQAALLGLRAWRRPLRYSCAVTPRHVTGGLMIVCSLAYPLLAASLVGRYPHIPTFGVPCPTTLLTIGFLLMATRLRLSLLAIPVSWTVIGGSAAVFFGVMPDWVLPLAGVTAVIYWVTALGRQGWSARPDGGEKTD
jgi:hypothetical protein